MSQPRHTGAKTTDSNLHADWLPKPANACDACGGSGNLTWRADGLLFELDDTPCDVCGGDGIDQGGEDQ